MLDQFFNLSGGPVLIDPNTGELNQPAIDERVGQLTKLIEYRQKIFATWSQPSLLRFLTGEDMENPRKCSRMLVDVVRWTTSRA